MRIAADSLVDADHRRTVDAGNLCLHAGGMNGAGAEIKKEQPGLRNAKQRFDRTFTDRRCVLLSGFDGGVRVAKRRATKANWRSCTRASPGWPLQRKGHESIASTPTYGTTTTDTTNDTASATANTGTGRIDNQIIVAIGILGRYHGRSCVERGHWWRQRGRRGG